MKNKTSLNKSSTSGKTLIKDNKNLIEDINVQYQSTDINLFKDKNLMTKEDIELFNEFQKSSKKEYSINFIINDTSRIANVIRRVLLSEIPCKILTFDQENFTTTDDFILYDDFQKRLNLIKINQAINAKSVFSLYIINENLDGTDAAYKSITIKANDIIDIKSKNNISDLIIGNDNIKELFQGKQVKIDKIYVTSGYGYESGIYQIPSNIKFKPLDYVNVGYLLLKGNIDYRMVKCDDLISKAGLKQEDINKLLRNEEKCLIITENNYYNTVDEEGKAYINKMFKYRIIKDIKYYQSTECTPKKFKLEINVDGHIKPKDLMNLCFDEILERLNKIKQQDPNYISIKKKIYIDRTNEYKFKFKQDTTLPEAFHIEINNLDENCTVLNVSDIYPLKRVQILTVNHVDAEKLFFQSCDILIAKFEKMKEMFNAKLK